LENWQYYLKLPCPFQRLIQTRMCENDTRTWKGALLLNNTPRGLVYSPWRASSLAVASERRANTAPCGEQVTRRGESWQTSVGKYDSSPQKPNFHLPQFQIWQGTQPMIINLNLNYTRILWNFYIINNQFLHVLQSIPISNPNSQIHKTTTTTTC